MTTTAGRWEAATASVRGASHERGGKPNQDAVRVVQVGGTTPGLVAAVCDGHGGDRYVRSDVGSRLGVEVACDGGRRALENLGSSPTYSPVEAHLAGVVATSIVERWRERVLEDVRHRPFTDDERVCAGVSLDGDPLISYGCTLLLAIMAPSWVGLLQIGDGDVTVVHEAHVESPVPDDDRLVGGETTSLCLPTAVADARACMLFEPLPEILILTSDGYANSFADPNWRSDAGTDLRDHVRRIGLDAVEARLPAWLADSATAGGDDVSMALIHRVDADGRPPSGRASGRTAPTTSTAASAEPWKRRGALFVATLAGAGGGWALARPSDAAGSTSTTSTASTSTSDAPTTSPITSASAVGTSPPTAAPEIVLTRGGVALLLVGENDGLLR